MESLFLGQEWTDSASVLDREICEAIFPILKAWSEKRYSLREIAYVAHGSIQCTELHLIALNRNKNRSKS